MFGFNPTMTFFPNSSNVCIKPLTILCLPFWVCPMLDEMVNQSLYLIDMNKFGIGILIMLLAELICLEI